MHLLGEPFKINERNQLGIKIYFILLFSSVVEGFSIQEKALSQVLAPYLSTIVNAHPCNGLDCFVHMCLRHAQYMHKIEPINVLL